jgi:hypothetical protein
LLQKNSVEANVLDVEGRHPLLNLALCCKAMSEENFFKALRLLVNRGATIKKVQNVQHYFEILSNSFSEPSVNVSFQLVFSAKVI